MYIIEGFELKNYMNPSPWYSFITPLRLLLKWPEYETELNKLEHHSDVRKSRDITTWAFHKKFVVNKLSILLPQFSGNMIKN